MKYLKQFTLIAGISLAGEFLHHFVDLPVPAGIYGMVLLFAFLETGVLKLSSVGETAHFLVEIMPVMFVPAAVGILESWEIIQPSLAAYLIITVAVTVLVMGTAGTATQLVIRKQRKDSLRRKNDPGTETKKQTETEEHRK